MKAFGDDTEEFATHAVDAINNVSNNMAVSSANIALALSKTSSAMATLGNTYEESVGLVTAGTTIMQGQSAKVARGLRTIGNNIANLAQQQKTLALETQEGTKQIQLFDEATGDMRSTYAILEEISKHWDEMNNAQKQAIGITLSGKNQFEVFASVEERFADAQKAVTLATESENSALDENAKFMESISAKTSLLKSQTSELVLGDGGLTDFVKILLDATNALLKFANSGVGKTLINLALLYTAIILVSKGLTLFNAKMGKDAIISLTMFIMKMSLATSATEAFNFAMESLNVNPIVLGITAVIAVGVGLYKLTQKLKTGIKDAGDALNESLSDLDSSKQKIDELKKSIAEINQEKLKVTDEEELRNLDIQQAKLESQLLTEQAIANEKERQLKADAKKAMNTIGWSYGYREGTHSVAESGNGAYGSTVDENLKNQIDDINKLNKEIDEYRQQQKYLMDTFAENGKLNEHYQKQYDNLSNSISTASDNLTKLTANSAENVNVVQSAIDAGIDENGAYQELINTWSVAVKQSDEVKESQLSQEEILEQTAEAYGLTAEAVKAYMEANDVTDITEACEALSQNAQDAEEVAKAYEDAINAVNGMEGAFKTLNDAVNEYNSTGELSLDTISDILSLDSEYLALLNMENGQMSINKDGAIALANAKINEAKAKAIAKAQTELAEIKERELNNTLTASSVASNIAVQSALKAGNAALESGKSAKDAEKDWAKFWKTVSNGYKFTSKEGKKQAKEVERSLKTELKVLDSLGSNVSKVTTATTANTKATKGNTKATKDNNNALKERLNTLKETKQVLEDTKKTYDDVISYIEKKITDAIKAIEDERDAELDKLQSAYDELEESTDKRIEQLKEESDIFEKSIKTQIDALKEEKKQVDDSLKDRIDALKDIKKQEEDYWQSKIDALKNANTELNNQIELENLLAQLERAKSSKKMIYREGQGFVYEADSEAVSTAQKNLQEYYRKRQYEKALKELEDYKDAVSKNYDEQIENLEQYRDDVNDNYDKQIEDLEKFKDAKKDEYDSIIKDLEDYLAKAKEQYDKDVQDVKDNYQTKIDYLQDYLDKFKKGIDAYENEQNRQQALLLTGIDFEKDGWETRLSNLEGFVQRYTDLQAQITEATRQVTEAEKAYQDAVNSYNNTLNSVGSGGGGDYSGGGNTPTQTQSEKKKPHADMIGKYYSWKKGVQYANLSTNTIGKTTTQGTHTMRVDEVVKEGNGTYWAIGTNVSGNQIKIKITDLINPLKQSLYSSGTYGIKDDGIAIVGDDPKFSELVIGSKLNSGAKILNANKGTGVIPHNLTSTLVSMAQAFQGQQTLQTTNNSTATTISIGNISLPNVENGEQFVDYLQNFNLDMTTLAYAR